MPSGIRNSAFQEHRVGAVDALRHAARLAKFPTAKTE